MDKIYTGIGQKCRECGKEITNGDHATILKVEWDGKEKFGFDKHATDELKGYRHLECVKNL